MILQICRFDRILNELRKPKFIFYNIVKKTVLFITPSLELGGAENQMVLLATHLKKKGCQCFVFALESQGTLRPELARQNILVRDGGLRSGNLRRDLKRAPWKIIAAMVALLKMIFDCKPTIIHAFLPLATFLGALCGRIMNVPLIITSRRALGKHQDRHAFLKIPDRIANRLSDCVTVNSQAVWDDTVQRDRINPSKLALIYNGIRPSRFSKINPDREMVRQALNIFPDDKIVITVANLIAYKGHSDLLKAVQIVSRRIDNLTILLVGEDRGIQETLMNEIAILKIERHIRFLGIRHDIPQLMAASDLSVLPSHEEGFSNVLLESMAAGLPVVATSVGGNPEAVVHGVTGWLAPPHHPAKLAEKMIDLLNDEEKSEKWGERGRALVKRKFSVERMVNKHLVLYNQPL
ncbi:glycosyltransferase [Desulfococcaceae bacterium HSG9]|nr:glycosyltransferase [Desulfococcaceae bacterium HSG9]